MTAETGQGRGLEFRLNADGSRLQAVYTPDGPVVPIDFAWLKHALDIQRTVTGLYIFETVSAELKKLYNAATSPFTIDIGERRDGTFAISMAPDLMSATLTISPPYGGKPVTATQVLEALSEKRIVSGILTGEIATVMSSGREVRDLVIATGRLPVNGEHAQLVSLIPEAREREPVADDQDIVDYRNFSDIVSVREMTPLMRRIPPTVGTPGEDILGTPLRAEDGQDIQFAPDLQGVTFDPQDNDLLLAAVAGMPVLVANGVIVEPVLKVKNVDLSTGNLHFDGSVEVTGDVREGMELVVAGEITIGGVVEAANIECGGDITIKGGIIGHGEIRNQKGELGLEHAFVVTGGSLSVLFVENACVEAAGDILVKELAMQSELTAGGEITIGEEGSRKGHLIGGICRAARKVRAIVVGSRVGVQTRIEVGVDPAASEKLDEVSIQLLSREKDLQETEKDLVYCRDNPGRVDADRLRELKETFSSLQEELTELAQQKKRLLKKLEPDAEACFEVERDVYYGVVVRIGDRQCQVDDDQFGGAFRRIENEVVFLPRT